MKGTPPRAQSGKVCIPSIDGGERAADGLLAGAALVRLEASLRRRTGDPKAQLADIFDVAAGSGAGGVLVAMLVAMAFGHSRASNYTRIQAMGSPRARGGVVAEEMLSQKNVESVLFRGKKLAEQTNAEKLERFAHELVKEHDRRTGASTLAGAAPAVVKQQPTVFAGESTDREAKKMKKDLAVDLAQY